MRSSALAAVAAGTAVLCATIKTADAGCGTKPAPTIQYSSSSNRMYVTDGCATIKDLLDSRLDGNGKQKGPIWHFDSSTSSISAVYTGEYYLTASVHINNGATLSIDGGESQDDGCEALYLASDSSLVTEIRAHGGNLDIRHTKIFSWDIEAGTYDTNIDDGRSYIGAVTEIITGREKDLCSTYEAANPGFTSSGKAKENMGTANMDIIRSELAYLGYDGPEAYGISYKARGLCKDKSNEDIYDDDNDIRIGVTGSIIKSKLHHNWFGHYSWGHDGGKLYRNEVHDNYGYGFDPHDDSDKVEIIENVVYNNGWHGIIASKRCTDIIIKGNTVYNNGRNGIMLHQECDRATVSHNVAYDNVDAGLALYETSDCTIHSNTIESNKHGIRWSNGASRNEVYGNIISVDEDGRGYAFYMYKGSDEPSAEGNVDGSPRDNDVYENVIFSEKDHVWKMEDAHDNTFTKNAFHGGRYATFADSRNNLLSDNIFPDAWFFKNEGDTCYDKGATPLCPS